MTSITPPRKKIKMNAEETSTAGGDSTNGGDMNGDTVLAVAENESLEAYVTPIENDSDSYVDSQELCQLHNV